jgi:hypothetical protein
MGDACVVHENVQMCQIGKSSADGIGLRDIGGEDGCFATGFADQAGGFLTGLGTEFENRHGGALGGKA